MTRFYLFAVITLIIILGLLTYQILKPFLTPVAWAIVFSITFYPVYVFILKYLRWKSIAAILTLTIILILILGPFSYLTYLLVIELKDLSDYLETGKLEALGDILQHPSIKSITNSILSTFNLSEEELNKAIIENISRLGKEIVLKITKGATNIVTVSLDLIFMVFSIFFFLRDGPEFLSKVRDYMPFSETQKDRLVKQIRDIIISTIYGGVAVSIIQGTIAGLSFFFIGIPTPVVWGLATSIASFVPLLGASSIWVPATIYLFLNEAILKGFILAIIGLFGISLVDNILKPIIIGGRTKMPILVIFFSVLGGIKLFGLIGLIIGPLVIALFISVVEIFRSVEGSRNA
ncbi:MAG: AI-2E family transporter [Thermodesulfovibrionales bacterium]